MSIPLQPELAAWHATVVQGGFSTPEIEAYRILSDAVRTLKYGPLDDRWKQGVRDTLSWLDEHQSPIQAQEERRFVIERRPPENWREVLEGACRE